MNRVWLLRAEQRIEALETGAKLAKAAPVPADRIAALEKRIEELEAKAHTHVGRPTKVAE